MTNLTKPTVDVAEFSAAFIQERLGGNNRRAFSRFAPEFTRRLNDYELNRGNPETITASSASADALKDALINLYISASLGSAHGDHIIPIRDNDLAYCPYCFSISRPTTLDHYLPKSTYPEFAVYPCNLVPMCSKCQLVKGENCIDSTGNKMFIHPYYDAIFGTRLLAIQIDPPFDVPAAVSVIPHGSLSAPWVDLVSRHIQNINVDTRYRKVFSVEYTRLRKNVAYARRKGRNPADIIDQFLFDARNISENCWSSILYDHALSNTGLLDYLCNGPVPENM